MRRLIGYITTCIAMLLAIVVTATPVITHLNTGREFTESRNYREIVFNIGENSSEEENENRASVVADEMRARLKNFEVEDYSIKVQGNDTVTVSLNMDKTQFNYTAKYLTFSGESFAFVGSNGEIKSEHKLFNPSDVKVEFKGDAKIPVVIIPLTSEGKADIEAIIEKFGETAHDHEHEEGEAEPQNLIYLWSNFDVNTEDLDSISGDKIDPKCRDKVIMAFNDNPWNPDSKEEKTELMYMCATGKEDNPSELDVSGLKDDNDRASYLSNMLKASKYDFEITCPTATVTKEAVDYFDNARVLDASAEKLIGFDANAVINFKSKTFIASAVAIVIISLLLIVFYRLTALGMIVTTLGTLFIGLISFFRMQVLFNVPAIIGLLTLGAGVLFGQIFYANKLKEEIYKGRSIKKANQEASKKSNMPTIDSAVVLAITGIFTYFLGDSALKPVGVALFFGAIYVLLVNMLLFKFLMYLLTNSTNLQDKYFVFNINKDKVPNIMSVEEKPAYEDPYEKADFTKRKTFVSILFGVLTVAAIACIATFGALSSTHSPLNVSESVKEQTVCYVSIDVTNDEENPNFNTVTAFKENVLKGVDLGITDDDIDMKQVSVYTIDGEEEITTSKWFVSIQNVNITDTQRVDEIEDLIFDNIEEFKENEENYVSIRSSKELIYTPNQGLIALATGLSIVAVALYAAIRFRPSRGIALLVTSAGATTIAYGAVVAMRFVATTALTAVAIPLVAVVSMLGSLFFFTTERAIRKDTHVELNEENRNAIMKKAVGKSAAPILIFMLCNIYIAINYFGFGLQSTVMLFASALIGEAVSVLLLLVILGPISEFFGKLFGKIKLPKLSFLHKENKDKNIQVKKTSEPEETIFIGIND